jgi:hypothetical protein
MRIELNDQERDELVALVRAEHADLNPEIARAMDNEFREQLHKRRDVLQGLLAKLGTPVQLRA